MTNAPERIDAPVGVKLYTDIEHRPNRPSPYRARVRWTDLTDPTRRPSRSMGFSTEPEAQEWLDRIAKANGRGVSVALATTELGDYGDSVMDLAMRGLELKTHDPYLAGWRLRVKPTVGHLQMASISAGIADRALNSWIADGASVSTLKNTIAVWVRVMEQAIRDGIIEINPARLHGWQRLIKKAEDEEFEPRGLALRDWDVLDRLAEALVEASFGKYEGWGDIVRFAGGTGARIGEVSGVRAGDIDTDNWIWRVCRQTTPGPGGLIDKGTKGKRSRLAPIIPELRPNIAWRISRVANRPDARLFTGPRGGRVTTAILRDATHWDDVVVALGYEYLRRHDLRHTALTWFADAGVPPHVLMRIAGHGQLTTTQRYLHPDLRSIERAGAQLTTYINATRGLPGPKVEVEQIRQLALTS
ncbi:site-specific integrase [Kitasatospora sp. A2-31]|uniref:tyrosine-type recombinase/integrase n=1 Tax=Kitasatospora sp. A2-31 TaxID=2916414 RepID=UPI001EEB0112|nr:site-specific integrase [Kitasatospora sp. A2-31]MCG6496863.1 site-specific integrase [Kitasatospora sp. A2-31]